MIEQSKALSKHIKRLENHRRVENSTISPLFHEKAHGKCAFHSISPTLLRVVSTLTQSDTQNHYFLTQIWSKLMLANKLMLLDTLQKNWFAVPTKIKFSNYWKNPTKTEIFNFSLLFIDYHLVFFTKVVMIRTFLFSNQLKDFTNFSSW